MAKSNLYYCERKRFCFPSTDFEVKKAQPFSLQGCTARTRARTNTNPYPFWNIAQAPSPDHRAGIIDSDKAVVLTSLLQMDNIHGISGNPNEGLKILLVAQRSKRVQVWTGSRKRLRIPEESPVPPSGVKKKGVKAAPPKYSM